MATVTLPVHSDFPHYTFQTDLAGVTYGVEVRWNDRAGAWFGRLLDAEGIILMSGVRLVTGFPLFGRSSDPRMPAGAFWLFDSAGEEKDPDRNDLGTRIKLLFFEEE